MADGLYYRDTRAILIADATQVTGTSETVLWTQDKANTALPANYFGNIVGQPGKTVKLTVAGKITTAASSPGNFTLTLRYGTTTGGTSLAASAATALTTSKNNITWCAECYVTCRAIGSTGSLLGWGRFFCDGAGNIFSTAANMPLLFPASSPAGTSVDTTAAGGIVLTATLGSASDLMTAQWLTLEALN